MSGWLGPLLQAGASIYGAQTARDAGRQQQQAAQQAAAQQQNATDQQLNLLTQMYNQNRTDAQPYRAAGQQGLAQYAAQVGDGFQASPGYQWTQNEAQRAVLANASSRGLVNSGSVLKALQDRSANLANQEYGNYMNRLGTLAGIGQTATGQGMQASQGYGGQASGVIGQGTQAANNYMTAGAGAGASGMVQGANALMGGANNILSMWAGR